MQFAKKWRDRFVLCVPKGAGVSWNYSELSGILPSHNLVVKCLKGRRREVVAQQDGIVRVFLVRLATLGHWEIQVQVMQRFTDKINTVDLANQPQSIQQPTISSVFSSGHSVKILSTSVRFCTFFLHSIGLSSLPCEPIRGSS